MTKDRRFVFAVEKFTIHLLAKRTYGQFLSYINIQSTRSECFASNQDITTVLSEETNDEWLTVRMQVGSRLHVSKQIYCWGRVAV